MCKGLNSNNVGVEWRNNINMYVLILLTFYIRINKAKDIIVEEF